MSLDIHSRLEFNPLNIVLLVENLELMLLTLHVTPPIFCGYREFSLALLDKRKSLAVSEIY